MTYTSSLISYSPMNHIEWMLASHTQSAPGTHTDSRGKTNPHLHVCISPPSRAHMHAHVYTQASTHADLMWHEESNTALSLLHTAWTIYNVLPHWIIDELCFLFLYTFSTVLWENSALLLMIHSGPLVSLQAGHTSYIIIIDTQSQINTPAQPCEHKRHMGKLAMES